MSKDILGVAVDNNAPPDYSASYGKLRAITLMSDGSLRVTVVASIGGASSNVGIIGVGPSSYRLVINSDGSLNIATASPLTVNLGTTDTNNLTTVATAQGAQGTGLNPPAGGSGVLGFLSGIYNKIIGTLTVSGTVTANLDSGDANNITTIATNTGAEVTKLTSIDGHITKADTDHVTVSVALPAGTALLGKVGIDQTTPGTTNAVSVTNALALESGGNLAAILADTADIEGSIASIDGKTPALGVAASAGSVPVVIASDQTAVPVSVDAETAADLDEMTASVANIPAMGAAASAASMPVNLASDQYGFLSQLLLLNTQILSELRALRLMEANVSGVHFEPLDETLTDKVN